MEISPLLIVFAIAIAAFALLRTFGERHRLMVPGAGTVARVVADVLASINSAAAVGLLWFAAGMLAHDGVMVIELSICAGLVALLVGLTACGVLLGRRGMNAAALGMLAAAALPTVLVYLFLLYLDFNPIDWR